MDRLIEFADSAESPSLVRTRRGHRAYEVKFVLDEPTAAAVERALSPSLALDPHADSATGMYTIDTLYTDTPAWSVFFGEKLHAIRKYRIRRYGGGAIYLERKMVRKSVVRKRRTATSTSDLESLIRRGGDGEAAWFVRQVDRDGLAPVCQVSYNRRALFGQSDDGPMRVTFDRSIQGVPVSRWQFGTDLSTRTLLTNIVVCEFKFRDAMPGLMKRVVADLGLAPRRVSKYRACVSAFTSELGLPENLHA